MSRQLPPFVHRGSRAPSSTAGSVLGGAGGGHGAHGGHGGGGAGGSRGGAGAGAGAGFRPGSRVSATPSLSNFYPPPRPHPLQQQAFYSDDFTTSAHPHPQVRQHSGLDGGPGGGPNGTNGTIQAFSNGSMPPPPPSTHHSALRMDSVLHNQPRSPLQEPEQARHAAIVLQCINCRLIVGDSYAWVDLIEPLDLLILTAASDQIRSDGDVDPESSPTEPDLLLAQQHQQRAATLQTSPEGEPDAASTWHVLRCECGEPLGRKYVSTSFPHLDGLRGNFSFNIHQVHVYHLGSHSPADGQNGSRFGGRGALLAEEFHKMQMLLMNVGERLMRVEDKLQLGPPPTQQPGTPMHFSSTPGPSGSSPAPSLQLATGPAPMGMPHRVKLVPNAQDAFLPPRVVARLTATPAPASGPSIATSAEMSSASQKSSSSHLTLRAQSGHQKAGQVSRSAVQSSHHDHGHQDTSPYSSPHTPTPAPSSQPSAASTRAQNTSSTTTRVNAAVGPGASSSSSRPLSPEKRSAAPDRNAAVSQNHAVNDINGAEDDNNDDEFDAIPPGDNGSPTKRRRREGPVATASGQGPTRERVSPASKPSAARGRPRKSLGSGGGGGGGAAAGRQSVPLSSAPAPSPRLVSRSVGVGVGVSDRANANADERMVVNMEDEDDELALGADSSVLAPISDEEEEEADKVRAAGRQNGRRRTVAASVGAIANPGVDDRKAMPPPPLPPTGMRGTSVPRSTKKTVAVA
ncbi:unnamed protein product [Tilletia controversa]|nr:unnamed protein product [Tilletia controversa]